ncbi:MAG: DegV family protein, partial [Spirochaetales bacterium]|nr:DegV family protein [Spirochaetales bacterium]
MGKRFVMCTSTGCIEYAPERYREYGIGIIRIHVLFQGKEYLEGYDLDPVDFYNELEKLENPKNNLPKTAMPTVEEIRKHFDEALAQGYDEGIVICISSYLGGTYNLIRLVAEDYQDKMNIHVIDSRITCFGEGLLAVRAAQMIRDGVSTEQILKEIDWMKARQEFIGVDGKLDYLIYNGRLKGGKAFMGKMLSICPVVHFTREGECTSLTTVRTPKKAVAKTCEIMKEIIGDRKPEDYILFHVYTGPSLISYMEAIEGE